MGLSLYDTPRRAVAEFVSLVPGAVRMYTCGPTVYSPVHVGNLRAYVVADLLRRVLEDLGLAVRHVVNITDVGHLTLDDIDEGEDKLEVASRRERLDAWQIAEKYTRVFLDASRDLGLLSPLVHPRATDHINDMIELIVELLDRGFAYATPDGNVYYDVSRFPSYGTLSGNRVDDLVAGARVELARDKRHPADFALWKRDPHHQMQWDSPWGRGFPGWHIECSAMARTHLGDQLDIHTGGEDNAFPHHECEIAQSEPVTGRPLAKWWVHVRHLFVDGRKMSKSAGTLHTLDDVRDRGFTARELRYLLLATHYRTNLNFTWDGLAAARDALASLDATLARIRVVPTHSDRPELLGAADKAMRHLVDGLHDDLNVSVALAGLHRLRGVLARNPDLSPGEHHTVAVYLERIDGLLGLQLHAALQATNVGADLVELQQLIQQREDARKAGNYDMADAIREKARDRGFTIEDTPTGPRWHRA